MGGCSLAEIARREIGPVAGATAAIAILFIIVIALAGLGLVVVNALSESAWGTFTIVVTIPIALFMGLYMYRWRPGQDRRGHRHRRHRPPAGGRPRQAVRVDRRRRLVPAHPHQLVVAMAIYGFIASVLPVWLLLAPRDYLSAFMKIGTVALLVVGVIVVNPELQMPAVTQFAGGGGPIIPGPLFPFVFITIACGAISGFHALIGSGTTPKMIDKESDIRPIGYGAMLIEGLVGVLALIAACALHPGDYFAINVAAGAVRARSGMPIVNLPQLEAGRRRESWRAARAARCRWPSAWRRSSAGLPGMKGLMAYWYHFAIMFEALFILTTIDTGTRVARFLVQEFGGRVYKPFGRADWLPGAIVSTTLVVLAWGYFIWTRQHQHHLADVRHREPAAGRRRAGDRHDHPHQHRPRAATRGSRCCR